MPSRTLAQLVILAALAALLIVVALPLGAQPEQGLSYLLLDGQPATLAPRLAELPVTVRLVDVDRVLLEVEPDALATVHAALPAAWVLGAVPPGMELCRLDPAATTAALESGGAISLHRDARLWLAACPSPAWLPAAQPLHAAYDLRALSPPPPAALASPFRRGRQDDPAARVRAQAMQGLVSEARIDQLVRRLAETAPGIPSSRFAGRPDFYDNFTVPLYEILRDSLFTADGDTVFLHPFKAYVKGDSVDFHNIIGRRPGRVPGSGRYVLGGHYDAIGSNTDGWDPDTSAAPGADDNASGVAAMMEAMRVLLTASFDFDLELVLFANEERWLDSEEGTNLPGLLGSQRLVADLDYGPENVLGAIVADMVGYNPRVDSLVVLTNYRSEWLADLLVEANDPAPPEVALSYATKAVIPTFDRSDHGSFWTVGADGILLIENPLVEDHNPHYDKATDTYEALANGVGFDQTRRVAELVVGALGQFSNPTGDVELASNTVFFLDDQHQFISFGHVGEAIEMRARLFNGGPHLNSVQVDVYPSITLSHDVAPSELGMIGNAGWQERMATTPPARAHYDTTFTSWSSGTWREIALPWIPGEDHAGHQLVQLEMVLSSDTAEQWTFTPTGKVTVLSSGLRILDAHVRPNPVRGDLRSAALSFQLTERGDVTLVVFDALGREVADTGLGFFDAGPLVPIPLDEILDEDLPSGIYLARLHADGSRYRLGKTEVEVKFAVAR